MRTTHLRSMAGAAALLLIQGLQPAAAQLTTLEKPWLGYFAVVDDSRFRFLLSTDGVLKIMTVNKDGAALELQPILLQVFAQETLPDGSVKDLAMKWDTVESKDPPAPKLQKTVFRCYLTDQAEGRPTLEVTIEYTSGTLLFNARIIDKGSFTQNPVTPVIRTMFAACYAGEAAQRATWDKKQIKDFDKMVAKDSVTLKHLDGKQVKLECTKNLEPSTQEVNGPGSASAVVEIGAYQKRRIELLAAPNSSLTLGTAAPAPLHGGFWFQWSADPVKDPDGKAKLAIKIK